MVNIYMLRWMHCFIQKGTDKEITEKGVTSVWAGSLEEAEKKFYQTHPQLTPTKGGFEVQGWEIVG